MATLYPSPSGLAASSLYEVRVEGRPAFVHDCAAGALCAFETAGKARVWVRPLREGGELTVRPLRRGIQAVSEDGGFGLVLEGPQNLYLDPGGGGLPLFLFANPPEADWPDPKDPRVRYFAGGGVYEAGRIELGDGETLYIEGGAVVRGSVYARGNGVSVRGAGLVDGSGLAEGSTRLLVFDGCRDLRVEGIMTMGTPSWNLVLGACERVEVDNVKLVGWVVSSDGIDVVGSRDVAIRGCFLRNNDDCVAIKAVDYRLPGEPRPTDWRRDVARVRVEGCTMFNDRAGNVMEIGFETQTESIRDVVFRDIDVLAGHGEGGVFTIHNGDRATISDVLYEDVRVEHFYDKLIDFRVMHSRYSKDAQRGRIENVVLRNISCVEDRYNTVSLVGGCDADHRIEGVRIENLTLGGRRVGSIDEIGLYSKHASEIEVV